MRTNLAYYARFLPAAPSEASLEIAFKVGPKVLAGEVETFVSTSPAKIGGGGNDICPPPPPNLAGEVETLVHHFQNHWVAFHATTAKTAFAWSG